MDQRPSYYLKYARPERRIILQVSGLSFLVGIMKFHEFDDQDLVDYLFESNLSIADIAKELYIPETAVRKRIKELGLSWIRRTNGGASRGQASLTRLMKQLLPGEEIISEYHIGERLRLDVYCPGYKLAAEYHGRQHFEFVQHFHDDKYGFRASQDRDQRKQELCNENGILLVVFRHTDELTENAVFSRLLAALQDAPTLEQVKVSRFKGNPAYEAYNQRQREYRKQAYQRMKGTRAKRN